MKFIILFKILRVGVINWANFLIRIRRLYNISSYPFRYYSNLIFYFSHNFFPAHRSNHFIHDLAISQEQYRRYIPYLKLYSQIIVLFYIAFADIYPPLILMGKLLQSVQWLCTGHTTQPKNLSPKEIPNRLTLESYLY